ncbi:branched-chain amino acid ABC transporter permease [Pseudonocardia sp. KRD-184]|uniref:Branched-chain amino acid ABC transporter permease n=1 Tax=Pseudonocardia oceani TaxID=2792013 RepID=A0ABS6UAL1_9PSEU|nr:branched-chain amino acid ABC transporter permease [Pseudonocardia oceani]MBW0088922.1 branched-chain amino acid ABC transporter permease [Pseudonocardia oceani]MBW0096091.1 branched-chain amino acid ABC transporter permease [Pseudonocardia oceani]MBW0108871.1 branched-chain amino acid ABC transporter permease [Pseudonocardia oceani]MBW0122687.1 branched-chain amino acid ABC transporter permease [Pseudonocardia oceani]MBW0129277.1 branched-chain amino acid ABC transporter permease [Pseudono
MTTVVQALVNALNLGGLYALYALGVAMVFGILRLVNFAHSSLIMAGGYTLVFTASLPLLVRLLLTVVACVALAMLLELVAFRGVRSAAPETMLVTSFAVSMLLASLAESMFGGLPRSTDLAPVFRESWTFGQIYLPKINVITVAVVVVLIGGLGVFLTRTPAGLRMRAAAEDFATARLLGVAADRVISLAFAISGVLAAAAAVLLLGANGSVTPTFGFNAVLFGLIAAVVGGLSSLRGAVVGGFVLGAASQLLQEVLPVGLTPFRDAVLFAAVFCLLVVRPQGIVGSGQGVRV